jgi:hypothetical protein
MTQIVTLKAQAANLVESLAARGIKLTRAQGLELIAEQYGMKNWDTLSGMLKPTTSAAPAPRLADMPGYPDTVLVDKDGKRVYYNVAFYDEEGTALLHDTSALESFLMQYRDGYPEGMATTALELSGDGHNLYLSFQELVGLTYQVQDGLGCWKLPDGVTSLTFICGTPWTPKPAGMQEPVHLPAIPQTVKSVKGVKVLQLTSTDGDYYDKFFLVPVHLDISVIKRKVDEEVVRLKERDRVNEEAEAYQPYMDTDIIAFVTSLGLEHVEPEKASENWDY